MTDYNVVQFAKEQTILTDEEFNRLEDWHAIVDATAEEIDKQLESFGIKDSEYWRWHEAAEELCREAAPVLFAKRPKDIADREGYTDVECVYDMLKGYLNLANEYYHPLSESSARKRLAKEGLRLRKLCEDNYRIINTKGEVVAGDDFEMCWDQVVRYTNGHRRGY
jgi:hypothetical protein